MPYHVQEVRLTCNYLQNVEPLISCKCLRILDLSCNEITSLPNRMCLSLVELYLTANKVMEVRDVIDAISGSNLTTLDLLHNPMCSVSDYRYTIVSRYVGDGDDVIHRVPSLQVLDGGIVTSTERSAASRTSKNVLEHRCISKKLTPSVKWLALQDIFMVYQKPEYSVDDYTLINVDKEHVSSSSSPCDVIEVDMSSSRLSVLPDVLEYSNLQVLNASDNDLTSVNYSCLPQNIRELSLEGNELTSIKGIEYLHNRMCVMVIRHDQ